MNPGSVEKALKAWLEPLLDGVHVLRGVDKVEMPTGEPCVIASVSGIQRPVPALGRASVVLVAATPYHHEGGIDAHTALATLLSSLAETAGGEGEASLGAHLDAEASLVFAGIHIGDGEQDVEGNRWLTSVPFTLGLRQS